jgi:type II secretory pathway component PulF
MTPVGDFRLLTRFSPTMDAVLQLLDAGYPFHKAILLLADFETDKAYHSRLLRMCSDMDQGLPFHVTLRHLLPHAVGLAIWDVTSLPDMRTVLRYLGGYISQKEQLLRTLFKSLLYPMVLLLGLILVLLLFVFQVVPAMGTLVESADGSLLSVLLGFREFCLQYMSFVLPGFFVFVGGVSVWFWVRGWARFLGLFFRPRAADVAWMMGVLLSNGMSVDVALSALAAHSNKVEIGWLRDQVLQSGQFSPGFVRFFAVRGIQAQLLLVSEKSGTLSTRLLSVGQALLVEDMMLLSRRIGLVQPVLLLAVGVLVWLLMRVVMAPLSTMIQLL